MASLPLGNLGFMGLCVQASLPHIAIEQAPTGAVAVLRGRWVATALARPADWPRVQLQLQQALAVAQGWDLRAVEQLDHVGVQCLWDAWGRCWPGHVELTEDQRAIVNRVAQLTVAAPKPARATLPEILADFSQWVYGIGGHVQGGLRLLGQLALDVLRLLRAPQYGPWRDVSGHIYHFGTTALPIIALVGFLIGLVLAYLMSHQLQKFGADAFIVNFLGLALIRELGPVLAAILVAGRSGSAMTAQIGVMRVTEELDAMQVMGIPVGFRLVLPRVLAMAIVMPLVAVWSILAALMGGMLGADLTLGLSPDYFMAALPKAVKLVNLWLAMGKAVVFGILIALIGCHYGLRIEPNTASLGEGTTASVVTAITMVLLVDALFAVLFRGVGM